MQWVLRLHDLSQSAMGFYFLSREDKLIVDIEQHQQTSDDQCPLGKETERPLKRDTAKEAQEQRRITKRREQSCCVSHDEYEEDNEMSSMPPQMIRSQERTDEQH